MRSSPFIKLSLLCLPMIFGYLCGLAIDIFEPRTKAQTPCATPPPSINGQSGTWNQNTRVTVNINPNDFNQDERACLSQAFANWNAANGSNGNNSGVYFAVQFSGIPIATLDPQSVQVNNYR